MGEPLLQGMQNLIGKNLLSVDFVEDYVQLAWHGWFLSAFAMPLLVSQAREYAANGSGYRAAMFQLVGQVTQQVNVVPDHAVLISFDNSSTLKISLQERDYVGPEIMHFGNASDLLWVV